MSEVHSFTARPLSKQPRSDFKDAFRVYLSSHSLAALRLRAGDVCSLTSPDAPPKTVIAWTATENIKDNLVQTSRILQDCYGVKVGEKVAISRIDDTMAEIESVILVECSDPEKTAKHGDISEDEKCHWEWALAYQLSRCETLAVGLIFDLELKGQRRSFQVANIQPQNQSTALTLFRFTTASKISISGDTEEAVDRLPSDIEVLAGELGGLSRQIQDINESLSDFNMDPKKLVMPPFYEPRRAILLYGPKGTGKTALLQQIEKAGWKQTFKIGLSTLGRSISEGEAKLRTTFQEAARSKPSVIIIDQLEFIAPKRTSFESQSLASVLCENLDALRRSSVLVVAATRHPNHVDDALRTPHRFATEIELQVPTAQDRAEILRAIRGPVCSGLSDGLIDLLAEKTHGYVGADLFALLQLVCRKARQRQLREPGFSTQPPDPSHSVEPGEVSGPLEIQEADTISSLQEIRPTAMREVFLETPKVRWSDIGGQHEIKRRLQKAVERPLKVSTTIESWSLLRKLTDHL